MRKHLKTRFHLKTVSDEGEFTGYGSVFDVKDSYSDVVLKGAFLKSLKKHDESGTKPAFLWQHKHDQPIGVYTEITEDEHGLFMRGQFNMDVQQSREAHSLLKQGALDGLSIGYSIPQGGGEWDDEKGIFFLSEINLWETSLVTFPANDAARVSTVKTAGGSVSKRDLEKYLRDVGLSKNDARALLADGWTGISRRDASDGADEIKNLLETIRGITNDY